MSAPDPESLSWLSRIIAPLGAVAAPVIWIHRQLNGKADKAEVSRCLEHIEKLYENAESDRKLMRDLHDSAMQTIQNDYHEIVRIITQK